MFTKTAPIKPASKTGHHPVFKSRERSSDFFVPAIQTKLEVGTTTGLSQELASSFLGESINMPAQKESQPFIAPSSLVFPLQADAVSSGNTTTTLPEATEGQTDTVFASNNGNAKTPNRPQGIPISTTGPKPADKNDDGSTTEESLNDLNSEIGVDEKAAAPGDTPEETDFLAKPPVKPEDDPAFQGVISHTQKVKRRQADHPAPQNNSAEVEASAKVTVEEQKTKNDQKAHIAAMDEVAKKERVPITAEGFKKMLKSHLDQLEKELPKNESDAKGFKKKKPIGKVKENIAREVAAENEKISGPLTKESKTEQAPASNAPIQEAVPIPKPKNAKSPKPINATHAVPKPKTDSEISMERQSESVDEFMAENEITEKQLAKSEEPEFLGALDQKKEAQYQAAQAPGRFRDEESAVLGTSEKKAKKIGASGFGSMKALNLTQFKGVLDKQQTAKTSDKEEQTKIYDKLEEKYNQTKASVTKILDGLSKYIDDYFETQAEAAKNRFEKNVEDGLDDIYGFTVIDDWLFGEDTEAIEKVFVKEKAKFIAAMDLVLNHLSQKIADELNKALKAIADGKKDADEYFGSLTKAQQKLAKEAYDDFSGKYDELEDTVYEKQDELAEELASQFNEEVASLRESFDAIKKEVSAGWIGGAINALKGVVETIRKLKQIINDLLASIASVISVIMADPIGFMSNLFDGLAQGFKNFKDNIKKHLIAGFFTWLTGALGPMGITISKDIFSISGIFNLVMQVLGLGWDYIRRKAVKLLGEPAVKVLEKSIEIFQLIRTKGIDGLWEFVKQKFTDLKETVIDAIRDMLITQVIEAGVKWLLSLLIPGAGFIKAIMAIKDIIVFFVESAMMLIPAITQGIKALAAGSVKLVATAMEEGLARLVPVVINLFAKLIGLSGLAKKVQKIIFKIRKRIDKAVNKFIRKAKAKLKKLLKKGKVKVKGAIKGLVQWWKLRKKFKAKDGKQHTLYLSGKDKTSKLMVASEPTQVQTLLKHKLKNADDAKKSSIQAAINKADQANALTAKLAAEKNDTKAKALNKQLDTVSNALKTMLSGILDADDQGAKIFLDAWLGKKVTTTKKTLLKKFTEAANKAGYHFFEADNGKQIRRGSKEKLPQLTIEGELLKEGTGSSAKPTHNNFIPDEMTITESNGKYVATYTTKSSDGKKTAKFKIDLEFDAVVKGLPDKTEVRKVEGKNLSSKAQGIGRGKWDSASSGFDNAHIIGDQFGGAGKNANLNIYPSSPDYNREEMAAIENKMASAFAKSGQAYNLEATAYLKDDTDSPNNLKTLLQDEFFKDNKKDDSIPKEVKVTAENKLLKLLQSKVSEDVKALPAQFMRVTYHSESLGSKFEHANAQKASKSTQLGADKDYDKLRKKFKEEHVSSGTTSTKA